MSLPFEVHHSALGQAWRARELDEDEARAMQTRLRVPEIVARVLAGRGVSDASADQFLDTRLKTHLPDPSSVIDLDKGVAHLADAIEVGAPIGIFGDYDVDGGTGTATIARYLKARGDKAAERGTIRASLPVNMRESGNDGLGNDLVIAYLPLPVEASDPIDRVWRAKTRLDELKLSPMEREQLLELLLLSNAVSGRFQS